MSLVAPTVCSCSHTEKTLTMKGGSLRREVEELDDSRGLQRAFCHMNMFVEQRSVKRDR